MRSWGAIIGLAWFALAGSSPAGAGRIVTVGYGSAAALRGLDVVERLPALHAAEVSTTDLRALRRRTGIRWVEGAVLRGRLGEPALVPVRGSSLPLEWQYAATGEDLVPADVDRAAAAVTIAVIDTGADLTAPDIAAKAPITHDVITGAAAVSDSTGHGTFVASLAGGSILNGDGVAGFGGDAQLLIVQANRDANTFTDADEAAGIVWAVDHGARIVNLSIGGTTTSRVERDAIDYAIAHDVLVVAAAGNTATFGNEPSYPAALLGRHGLAVAASTAAGQRASFSTVGAYVALGAPGVRILGAVSSSSSPLEYPRVTIPGATAGSFSFASGTSYAAPEVAGAAALVWAADPALTADGVARILELTANGTGVRTPQLGYGVLDVAAAVAKAGGVPAPPLPPLAAPVSSAPPTSSTNVSASVPKSMAGTAEGRRSPLRADLLG